jgi:hypothetical protein
MADSSFVQDLTVQITGSIIGGLVALGAALLVLQKQRRDAAAMSQAENSTRLLKNLKSLNEAAAELFTTLRLRAEENYGYHGEEGQVKEDAERQAFEAAAEAFREEALSDNYYLSHEVRSKLVDALAAAYRETQTSLLYSDIRKRAESFEEAYDALESLTGALREAARLAVKHL